MPGKTIVTLDLEASSLDETGYPIEVACVLGNPSGITGQFSTFIRPRSSWRAAQHWSPASAAIHGIAFDRLGGGLDADVVCDLLDRLLGGLLVSVDGGTYDEFWLARLYNGRPMAFALDHLAGINSRDFIALKTKSLLRHRALDDATWLWHTVAALRLESQGTAS